jgi:hypothetical protein
MSWVSCEGFVSSVAGECNFDVFSGFSGEEVGGDGAAVGEWFIEEPDELIENIHRVWFDLQASVVRVQVVGCCLGEAGND